MGSALKNRLEDLQAQANLNDSGRVPRIRTTLFFFVALALLASVLGRDDVGLTAKEQDYISRRAANSQQSALSTLSDRLNGGGNTDNGPTAQGLSQHLIWKKTLKRDIEERVSLLQSLPFGNSLAESYVQYSSAIGRNLSYSTSAGSDEVDLDGFYAGASRYIVSMLLRIGFVFFAFIPVWLIGFVVGWYVTLKRVKPIRGSDILGICDPGKTPFYSGIWGPFQPNSKVSGTEFACSNLACPQRVKAAVAVEHQLVKSLRSFGAFNETTLDLVRVILAYPDYPRFVEEERPVDEEIAGEGGEDIGDKPTQSKTNMFDNSKGTILESSLEGLPAVLKAHALLCSFFKTHQRDAESFASGKQFKLYRKELETLAKNQSDLTQELMLSLTPFRAHAITSLSSKAVATAYLSIEAGKVLVYDRVPSGFVRYSRYPHLQARAIVQSVASFRSEFDGDTRLFIRQALLSSRRHGDFGRALLPARMAPSSRALRDWLEILFSEPQRRAGIAKLVELDGHIDEVHYAWRQALSKRLRAEGAGEQVEASDQTAADTKYWKGIAYKSVVLMPLHSVVETALSTMRERQSHITALIAETRTLQSSLGISARLPGFKRQALEATSGLDSTGIAQHLISNKGGQKLIDSWLIVRRMLTRYNWLSTRVGDDSVPSDGLVTALLEEKAANGLRSPLGLHALVPLRVRRYRELFGPAWERTYYADNPHPNDLTVFVDYREFQKKLKQPNSSDTPSGDNPSDKSAASA